MCILSLIKQKIYAQGNDIKNVLVINSYSEDLKWTSDIVDGIKDVFFKDNKNVNIYFENMDTKNIKPTIEYEKNLLQFYKKKYSNINFNAIICSDNDSLSYLNKYNKELLLENIPVVFCGINEFSIEMVNNIKNYTGVLENEDIESNIFLIKKYHPSVKNIIVIYGNTLTGKLHKNRLLHIKNKYKNDINLILKEGIYIKDLKKMLKDLDSTYAVLLMTDGLKHDLNRPIYLDKYENNLNVKFSKIPIYTLWDFIVVDGVVGGKVISGFQQGKLAAKIADRILNGEKVNNIPIINKRYDKYLFNYKELNKFNISMDILPYNSTIIGKPFYFWERYKKIVIVTLIIISTLVALIILLLININERLKKEKELKESYSQISATEEELKSQYDMLVEKEEELFESEDKFKKLYVNMIHGVVLYQVIFDEDTKIPCNYICIDVNPSMEQILDMKKDELIGKTVYQVFTDIEEYWVQQFVEVALTGEPKQFENYSKDLKKYFKLSVYSPKRGQFAVVASDITSEVKMQNKLEHMVYYDILTNLPSKISFMKKLREELDYSIKNFKKGGLLFIDLDDFKKINSILGHDFGDKLLQNVAKRIRENVREKDFISTFGGDEFLVLCPDIKNKYEITHIANNILDSFNNPFEINCKQVFTSASIGIAIYPKDGTESETILKNSNTAMCRAKELGKRTYKFYNVNMYEEVLRETEVEKYLRTAIENNELMLHYQPQLNLSNEKVNGVESLVRWYNPNLGFVSPMEFISIAEKTGLITKIGNWILKEVCRQAKEWIDKNIEYSYIAVNISYMQLKRSDFVHSIKAALNEAKLDARYIEIEITESILMENLHENVKKLKQLRNMGIKIALDDFGTGYSSLNYLRSLPINTLKMDKSFIDNINYNVQDRKIVDGIIQLGHKMNLSIIAEGVEDKEQMELLKKMGCDKIQGYYFSKPIPPKEAEEILKDKVLV